MSDSASKIVRLGKGAYPDTPLDAIPGWYLGMVLGGAAADCPWNDLTEEQQAAVIAENKRRHPEAPPTELKPVQPASSLETAQETHAKQVLQDTGGAAASTAPTAPEAASGTAEQAASDARVEAAVDAAVPTTGKGSRKAKNAAEGTVTEAHDIIAAADLEELGVIEKAENAGKNRVTVHAMIDKRRAELQPASTTTTGSSSVSPSP